MDHAYFVERDLLFSNFLFDSQFRRLHGRLQHCMRELRAAACTFALNLVAILHVVLYCRYLQGGFTTIYGILNLQLCTRRGARAVATARGARRDRRILSLAPAGKKREP